MLLCNYVSTRVWPTMPPNLFQALPLNIMFESFRRKTRLSNLSSSGFWHPSRQADRQTNTLTNYHYEILHYRWRVYACSFMYVCVWLYVCNSMDVCVCLWLCVCMRVYVCSCLYVCVSCVYVCLYVIVCMCVYVCTCTSLYVCLCLYVYMCVCV